MANLGPREGRGFCVLTLARVCYKRYKNMERGDVNKGGMGEGGKSKGVSLTNLLGTKFPEREKKSQFDK